MKDPTKNDMRITGSTVMIIVIIMMFVILLTIIIALASGKATMPSSNDDTTTTTGSNAIIAGKITKLKDYVTVSPKNNKDTYLVTFEKDGQENTVAVTAVTYSRLKVGDYFDSTRYTYQPTDDESTTPTYRSRSL